MQDLGNRLVYQIQRQLEAPTYKFSFLAGKAFFAVSSLVRWGALSLLVAGTGVALQAGARLAGRQPVDLGGLFSEVAGSGWFLTISSLLLLLSVRRVLLRFEDREV